MSLGEAGQRPAGRHVVPVDLAQHRLGARLARADRAWGSPRSRSSSARSRGSGRAGQPLPDDRGPGGRRTTARSGQSPGGSTAFSRHCSIRWVWVKVPSFSTCEAAGRKNTSVRHSLRHDLAGLDLRAVLPERGALDHEQVADHQPVQVGHAEPLRPAVRRADRRVLAEQEVALDLPVDHVEHLLVGAVVAGQPGQVAVAEVVLRRWPRRPSTP